MRISDWSSDVCSSDLDIIVEAAVEREQDRRADDEVERRDRRDPEKHAVEEVAFLDRPERDADHDRADPGADADQQDEPGDARAGEEITEEDRGRDGDDSRHRTPRDGASMGFGGGRTEGGRV